MTVLELSKQLQLRPLAGQDGMQRNVCGGYTGDLLSWVMGRAPAGAAWITVMGNANAVAVAVLADISCIVLCEASPLDEEARMQADANSIPVLASPLPAYELAIELSRQLATP